MSSTRIEQLIDNAQAAFDRGPTDIEAGLEVEDAALLQLWKACRLLAAEGTLQQIYDTISDKPEKMVKYENAPRLTGK